jgi:hypothetical protein
MADQQNCLIMIGILQYTISGIVQGFAFAVIPFTDFLNSSLFVIFVVP